MGKINLLSFEVANLIAAGEVVDRPASAVKELLENAIDAGATQIIVEIQHGGVSFIRIADNGCGIDKDDLAPAITRHSTSKIKEAADLTSIFTLGFRGEALAAIAAVSKLRIFSKMADNEMGALLEAEGGRIRSITDIGCRNGTTVIVEELFYNVPARRKFLKKDSTEAIAIGAVVEKIALSHPEISIQFLSDGEIKFMTSGKGDLNETIWALFGRDTAKRSLKVDREEGGIRVSGYVSESDLHRSNRSMENFFINGRYIKSKTATAALEQAYASKIPHDRFPFCVLNIALNPAAVDVNVHPAKLEVKFADEKRIFDAVYYAVLSALDAAAKRPELTIAKPASSTAPSAKTPPPAPKDKPTSSYTNAFLPQDKRAPRAEQIRLRESSPVPHTTPSHTPAKAGTATARDIPSYSPEEASRINREAFENIKKAAAVADEALARPPQMRAEEFVELPPVEMPTVPPEILIDAPPEPRIEAPPEEEMPPEEDAPTPAQTESTLDLPDCIEIAPGSIPEYFILGEAFNCYVLVQIADRLLLIDKHAAHERILFDELCRKMHAAIFSGARGGQILLTPYDIPLHAAEVDALGEYAPQIAALGFAYTTEKAGVSDYTVHLSEIPEDLNTAEAAELFVTLADQLSDATASVESAANRFFASRLWQASCKAAIKGGRVYDMAHIRWICDRLLQEPDGTGGVIRTCPHGRPVAFEIKKSSIDRQFARLT